MNPKIGDIICPECNGDSVNTDYYFPCHKCKGHGYINWLKELSGGNKELISYKMRICYNIYKKILEDKSKILILKNHKDLRNFLFMFYAYHNKIRIGYGVGFPWWYDKRTTFDTNYKKILSLSYGIVISVSYEKITSYLVTKKSFMLLKNKNKEYDNTCCDFID